ncbi:MAG TPA: alpha/beta hydrolase, partial [Kofleriaceae bacterium]
NAAGERIAYVVDGRGPWLVFPAWWVSHVERDLDNPGFAAMFERLASHFRVVRYDRPGVGLSDAARGPRSLDSEVSNLAALVDELGAEQVALFGGSCGSPPAVAFAARHPGRTSHLVLFGSYASGPCLGTPDLQAAMVALVRAHWGLGSKTLLELFAPEHSADEREQMAALQRASSSAEMAATLLELIYSMDASAALDGVRAPTLVMHRKDDRAIPFDHGRELAARIRDATFVPLEGGAHFPWIGDWETLVDATIAFIEGGGVPHREAPPGQAAENRFLRDGDVWRVAFEGKQALLPHARGLGDIALLLARPGEEVASLHLASGGVALPTTAAEPILDERARRDLARHVRALEETIERAESAGNQAAALRAARERDTVLAQLRAATKLGGRPRALPDPTERARKAVTARIRDSIDKLRGRLPALGHHLDEAIVTGAFCSYRPKIAVRWRT